MSTHDKSHGKNIHSYQQPLLAFFAEVANVLGRFRIFKLIHRQQLKQGGLHVIQERGLEWRTRET